jgi:hypothetical protein
MAAPIPLIVVSSPAVSSERTSSSASSVVISPVSVAAWICAQPAGGEVLTLALLGDPGDVWSGALERLLP